MPLSVALLCVAAHSMLDVWGNAEKDEYPFLEETALVPEHAFWPRKHLWLDQAMEGTQNLLQIQEDGCECFPGALQGCWTYTCAGSRISFEKCCCQGCGWAAGREAASWGEKANILWDAALLLGLAQRDKWRHWPAEGTASAVSCDCGPVGQGCGRPLCSLAPSHPHGILLLQSDPVVCLFWA